MKSIQLLLAVLFLTLGTNGFAQTSHYALQQLQTGNLEGAVQLLALDQDNSNQTIMLPQFLCGTCIKSCSTPNFQAEPTDLPIALPTPATQQAAFDQAVDEIEVDALEGAAAGNDKTSIPTPSPAVAATDAVITDGSDLNVRGSRAEVTPQQIDLLKFTGGLLSHCEELPAFTYGNSISYQEVPQAAELQERGFCGCLLPIAINEPTTPEEPSEVAAVEQHMICELPEEIEEEAIIKVEETEDRFLKKQPKELIQKVETGGTPEALAQPNDIQLRGARGQVNARSRCRGNINYYIDGINVRGSISAHDEETTMLKIDPATDATPDPEMAIARCGCVIPPAPQEPVTPEQQQEPEIEIEDDLIICELVEEPEVIGIEDGIEEHIEEPILRGQRAIIDFPAEVLPSQVIEDPAADATTDELSLRGSRGNVQQIRGSRIVPRDRCLVPLDLHNNDTEVLYLRGSCSGVYLQVAEVSTEQVEPAKEEPIENVADELAFAPRPLTASVWPNPTRGMVNFAIDEPTENPYTVEVFDLRGKRINTVRSTTGAKSNLQMAGYSAGIYVYRITDEASGLRSTGRLVVE